MTRTAEVLKDIADSITDSLKDIESTDPIHQCGTSPLKILLVRPSDVIDLAYQKLNTWPYAQVPICWRRLYEDACLAKAHQCICSSLTRGYTDGTSNKRRRLEELNECSVPLDSLSATFSDLIEILDRGLNISGAPYRADLFATIFSDLAGCIDEIDGAPKRKSAFENSAFEELERDFRIDVSEKPLSIEQFQVHLDAKMTPLVIKRVFEHWPALENWRDPCYFLRLTLGGRRRVPVEIGRSYTDETWSQRFMPFKDFLESYIFSEDTANVGYLAQHDLFAQIPQLRNDICIPDYCWTVPPSNKTMSDQIHLDEPLLNAWFGPRGTKTPLHTDPYHNILCQVVGYKYLRLYSPKETTRLYPRGADERGVDMHNTSSIDVEYCSYASRFSNCSARILDEQFPEFHKASFQEVILGPGDSLYIPSGWWHYAESLSISFSVSFWWS